MDIPYHLRTLKWLPFPLVKVVEVKLSDKVPLTPSHVSAKFPWNNQNRFGLRSAKM